MTSKNISITEDVYRMLSRLKLEGESFSDAIRRLARRSSLAGCAGLWSGLPEEELKAFEESIRELRRRSGEALRARGIEGR
ncbi:MAG: antitoxin VapB family protein [Candidatus Bathyarchaeia archaeon]